MSETELRDPLTLTLDDLEISKRLKDGLLGNACDTVRDICQLTEAQFRRTPNLGKVSLVELKEVLDNLGLHLREEPRRDGVEPLPFPSVHLRLTRIEQRLAALERLVTTGKP